MTRDELTAIRQRLGLGPVAMARALGVSYSTYRDWQSGKTRVHPAAVRCAELLQMLGDTPSDYVSESLGNLVANAGESGLSRCKLINGVWHGWKR